MVILGKALASKCEGLLMMKEEKMSDMKKRFIAWVSVVYFLLFSFNVFGVGLGVSPANLEFDNVLKGGYAQKILYVSTDSSYNVTINIERMDEVGDWLVFDDNITSFTINRDNPRYLKVQVYPPEDIISTNYTGSIRIVTSGLSGPNISDEGKSNTVLAAFLIRLRIGITGDQILSCNVGGISISDSEVSYPLKFSSIILNQGNVRVTPDVTLEIWDKFQEKIIRTREFTLSTVLPTEQVESFSEITNDLMDDQYWARINIPLCNVADTLTFSVVEKGGVNDKGEFLRIEAPVWSKANEIIPINAYFRNDGTRIITAKFKGDVKDSNGKIVKIIDTDYVDINPNAVGELGSFFKPAKEGQYVISGKILFNKKITQTKEFILNINGVAPKDANEQPWLILIILVIIGLILLILIKKKKQKKKR